MSSTFCAMIGFKKENFSRSDFENLIYSIKETEILKAPNKERKYFLLKLSGFEIVASFEDHTAELKEAYKDSYLKPHYWRRDLVFVFFYVDGFVFRKNCEFANIFVDFIKNVVKDLPIEFVLFDEINTIERYMYEDYAHEIPFSKTMIYGESLVNKIGEKEIISNKYIKMEKLGKSIFIQTIEHPFIGGYIEHEDWE